MLLKVLRVCTLWSKSTVHSRITALWSDTWVISLKLFRNWRNQTFRKICIEISMQKYIFQFGVTFSYNYTQKLISYKIYLLNHVILETSVKPSQLLEIFCAFCSFWNWTLTGMNNYSYLEDVVFSLQLNITMWKILLLWKDCHSWYILFTLPAYFLTAIYFSSNHQLPLYYKQKLDLQIIWSIRNCRRNSQHFYKNVDTIGYSKYQGMKYLLSSHGSKLAL